MCDDKMKPEDFIIHEKNGEYYLCKVIDKFNDRSSALDDLLDILMVEIGEGNKESLLEKIF